MNNKYIANSFQVPNAIVDEVMNKVSGNAFKCYMLIVRKTTGWNKVSDRIATTLFIEKTGIVKKLTVYKALDELEALNLVVSEKKRGQINNYRLNFDLLNQCPEEVVPQEGTSAPDGNQVVPQKDTPSSPPKGHPTKHTIKPTVQNTNTKDDFVLPDWIDSDLWADFVDMRKQIKKPMSAAAAKLLVNKLDGFRAKGFDVAELIENSIIGGWPSVYEPKTSNKPSGTAAFDPVAYINQNRTSKQGGSHESIDSTCQRMD